VHFALFAITKGTNMVETILQSSLKTGLSNIFVALFVVHKKVNKFQLLLKKQLKVCFPLAL
jgi:hypothetical protein